ncbi:hypothetical protein H072_1328 [Dactylellina haptotyla CBS 200.50]|uniref:Protein kinase domain-containing protein n=1 Tax=Dactylellina haptotyla (strain CBS 200.50) TaxID=1284197 RepID=S8BYY2_DACHA|nr:hypothetical protein H072_1328 [Dactylellina haptotyla CBS 200.50]
MSSEKRGTDVTEPTPNVDSPVKKKVKTDEEEAANGHTEEAASTETGEPMAVEKDTNGTETKTDGADAAASWAPPPFGSVCWIQIPATDVARAKKFYQEYLDFDFKPTPEGYKDEDIAMYTLKNPGGMLTGGITKTDANSVPSNGTILYFMVEDVDQALEKAESLGGKIRESKKPEGKHGLMGLFEDTEGNVHGVYQMAPAPTEETEAQESGPPSQRKKCVAVLVMSPRDNANGPGNVAGILPSFARLLPAQIYTKPAKAISKVQIRYQSQLPLIAPRMASSRRERDRDDDSPSRLPKYMSITGEPLQLDLDKGFLGKCRHIDEFESLNQLGEGTYGVVRRARDRKISNRTDKHAIVALKQVRIFDEDRNNGIPITALREIFLLRDLKHRNVVRVLDIAVGDELNDVYMVMEYAEQVGLI